MKGIFDKAAEDGAIKIDKAEISNFFILSYLPFQLTCINYIIYNCCNYNK